MKKTSVINCRLAILTVASMASCAWAQTPAPPAPAAQAPATLPVIKTRYQQVEATVEAIDPATRIVTLRGPKGPLNVVVGDEVKNFANIHVGDKVVVSYYQGLAVQMAKGDAKAMEPAAATFDYRAPGGQRPAGGAGASVTATVTIIGIQRDTNTVAFTTPDGSVHMVAVKSPNMVTFLHTLKTGDKVEVTYTESLAVKVQPATPK